MGFTFIRGLRQAVWNWSWRNPVLAGLLISGIGLPGAYGADSSIGCGIGTLVFKDKSLVSTSAASSLDGTVNAVLPGARTFAMTSGTSGCKKHDLVKNDRMPIHFLERNFQMVMVDIAGGGGEYSQAFARTLGCSAGDQASLHQVWRQNFGAVFGAPIPSAAAIHEAYFRMGQLLRSQEALSPGCGVNLS